MACARKWRELIAGRRWMVAGKWWCPGPCGGRRVTALEGCFWRGTGGSDTITHPQTTAGPAVGWGTFWASLELWIFFFYTFNPPAHYMRPQGGVGFGIGSISWKAEECVLVVFLAILSRMTDVSIRKFSSICSDKWDVAMQWTQLRQIQTLTWSLLQPVHN